jgi:hypothetical protein
MGCTPQTDLAFWRAVRDHGEEMIRGRETYTGLERRRHVRHDVVTTFWLMTPDGASLLMKSMNVSAGGAFLGHQRAADELPGVGTRVRFVLTAVGPEAASEAAKMAEIVRMTPAGMAIRFIAKI